MGKSTISMAMFNSFFVCLPEANLPDHLEISTFFALFFSARMVESETTSSTVIMLTDLKSRKIRQKLPVAVGFTFLQISC